MKATERVICPKLSVHDVPGVGAFLLWEGERVLFDVEYIAAVESYEAGVLGDRRQRPSAWYAEWGCWLIGPWLASVRIERADDLPGAPAWQHGVSTSYGLTDNLVIAAEYLRGDFSNGEKDRDLALLQLTFSY